MGEVVLASLGQYLIRIPVFLVWVVGIVLAVITWSKHAKVSLLTIIAIVTFGVLGLISNTLSVWLPLRMHDYGWTPSRIGMILTVVGVVQSLVSAVLWGLLIAAIFGWRSAK
jgi:hypothetical protein